jgi:hypothetical protein
MELEMTLRRALRFLLLLGALGPAPASAVVVYETYSLGNDNMSALLNPVQYAYPFDVSGGNFPLEMITLSLFANTSPGPAFILRLRDDDAGEPGNILEEWDFQGLPMTVVTDVEFVSVVTPTLLDGQRYWVNLTVESGIGGSWRGTGTETADMKFAQTLGPNPVWLDPNPDFVLPRMMVEAPEPGQALLAAAGALVLSVASRARRRS